MFEILVTLLKIYGPSLFGGLGIGLLYFYWMRRSICLAAQMKHAFGWMAIFAIIRLLCLAGILVAVLQYGFGTLVFFMFGFTIARFTLVTAAVYEKEGAKDAV